MKKVLGIVMALLLAVTLSAAWAEEIQGKIQKVDGDARMFVLEDGTQIWVAEGVSMESLKEGAQVKASYEERGGRKVATELSVSE